MLFMIFGLFDLARSNRITDLPRSFWGCVAVELIIELAIAYEVVVMWASVVAS